MPKKNATHAAIDATGISIVQHQKRWNAAYPKGKDWVKFHALVDIRTKAVFSWELTNAWSHDGKHLPGLLERARTRIAEVYADAAYLSRKNAFEVRSHGAVPFLRPKKKTHAKPQRGLANGEGQQAFQLMIESFNEDRQGWLKRYGRRNTVESVFGAIKRRFGPAVGGLSMRTQRIDTCLKVLVWNLTRLPLGRF